MREKGWFTQVSDIAAERLRELEALRADREKARELYDAMLTEINRLRAENEWLRRREVTPG